MLDACRARRHRHAVVVLAAAAACGGAAQRGPAAGPSQPPSQPPAAAARCEVPGAPELVRGEGEARLERWELDAAPVLFEAVLPDDAAYAAYRAAIREAGAELERPIADRPPPRDAAERARWEREDENRDLAYSGRAGAIRPIRCLEAWAFARQHARRSQLAHPTELMLAVLERRDGARRRLRLYLATSDRMFPPKLVYPFDDVAADVARGWTFAVLLHNHTIQRRGSRPALGVTAPSTTDVQLFRALAAGSGLGAAWITNGVFTLEIPAAAFAAYRAAD